jgi:hypothetical protein
VAKFRYDMDPHGLNRYARESPQLKAIVRSRAELGARMAKMIAPVGVDSPNPGEFRRSIHVVEHPVRDEFGMICGYRIVANSRDAVWAEFGRTDKHPYEGSHTLGKVADYLSPPTGYRSRTLGKRRHRRRKA